MGQTQCNCFERLAAFNASFGPGKGLPLGTVVECDCRISYKLKEDQRDGQYWQRMATVFL